MSINEELHLSNETRGQGLRAVATLYVYYVPREQHNKKKHYISLFYNNS